MLQCKFRPQLGPLGKRLIKSPKIYIADSGLACHLLGIETDAELRKSPFIGSLFEGFVAAEIAKAQVNTGRRREIYFFRDQQGLEVDFVVPRPGGGVRLIEVKAFVHGDAGHGRTDATASGGLAETSRRPRDRRHGAGALAHAGGDVIHRAGARRQSAPLAAIRRGPAGVSACAGPPPSDRPTQATPPSMPRRRKTTKVAMSTQDILLVTPELSS